MADDVAKLGAGLDELMRQAHALRAQPYEDFAVIATVYNEFLGACERLNILADVARGFRGQPLDSEPMPPETGSVYPETPEPLPHERKPMNPKLSEALRRDGS
jgi:hypothetical protein